MAVCQSDRQTNKEMNRLMPSGFCKRKATTLKKTTTKKQTVRALIQQTNKYLNKRRQRQLARGLPVFRSCTDEELEKDGTQTTRKPGE